MICYGIYHKSTALDFSHQQSSFLKTSVAMMFCLVLILSLSSINLANYLPQVSNDLIEISPSPVDAEPNKIPDSTGLSQDALIVDKTPFSASDVKCDLGAFPDGEADKSFQQVKRSRVCPSGSTRIHGMGSPLRNPAGQRNPVRASAKERCPYSVQPFWVACGGPEVGTNPRNMVLNCDKGEIFLQCWNPLRLLFVESSSFITSSRSWTNWFSTAPATSIEERPRFRATSILSEYCCNSFDEMVSQIPSFFFF